MATGGGDGSPRTLAACSDMAHEYACTLCVRKNGTYSEASNYCPDCDQYYCRPCLQHSCEHGSLGRAKMDRWGKPSRPGPGGQSCSEHTGNMVQLYCGAHDEVACHVCVAEKHGLCSQIKYISELSSMHGNKSQLKDTQREIKKMKSALDTLQQNRISRKETLQAARTNIQGEMREFRRKIISWLDDLERHSLDELDEYMERINDGIETESQNIKRLQLAVNSAETILQNSNMDDITRFIWLNQTSKILKDGRTVVARLETGSDNEVLEFKFHTEIETCLRNVDGLGKLLVGDQHERKQAGTPYSVQDRESFNARVPVKPTCIMFDMCQLQDGRVVISDYGNRCLKLVDSLNRVVKCHQFQHGPYGLCNTGDAEIAVAFDDTRIEIISVTPTFETSRELILKHRCSGIACSNSQLYMTNYGSCVYVYSMAGICQRVLKFDEHLSSNDDVTYIRRIRASPGGAHIYITNPNKAILVTINSNGDVTSSYKVQDIKAMVGLCVDDVGNVFLCGKHSNNVIQVDPTRQRKVADIVLPTDGISKPCTIYFDKTNTRLLVASFTSDIINSIYLKI